jgi:hypothetical protein
MREYYHALIALLLGNKEQADNIHYAVKLDIMSANVDFLNVKSWHICAINAHMWGC